MIRSARLQEQWALYDEQEYELAFEQARALLDQLQGSDLRDAYRLVGLACHRQEQYGQASFWLRRACQGSDQAGDWLNLAVSATMQGDMELSAQAFEQVRICQQAARYGQAPGFYLQLYWHACALCDKGEYEPLQDLLDELAQVYRRLHSTDSAFLFARGLPFLSSLLSLATRRFREQGESAAGVVWMQALGEALDDEGQRQVKESVQELREAGGPGPTGDT
jgi:hypothetical protein